MASQVSLGMDRMGMIRLSDKPPLTVSVTDAVVQAARAMNERHVGAAAVLEGTAVVGVVTERDMMQKIVAVGRDPGNTRVSEIMSSPAISVSVHTSVAEAAALMRKNHIRHLVVLNEQEKLVGMLALRYLLYDLMDYMQSTVGDLIGYIMNDAPGG